LAPTLRLIGRGSFSLFDFCRLRLLRRVASSFAEGARLWRTFGERALHCIVDHNPATFGARDRAADHDQSTLRIGLHHAQILRRDVHVTHMAGHLLAFEYLAWVLALPGRAMASMADRNAVRSAQAAEIVALDDASKTLADARARHIDILAFYEVIGGELGAPPHQILRAHPKICELPPWLDIG